MGGMALMICVNYPYTMYGALQNVEQIVWGTAPGTMCKHFVEAKMAVQRVFWVVVTLVLAAVIPNFGFLVGLCGCFSGSLLAFTLPCAFYLQLHWEQLKEEKQYSTILLHVVVF